MAGYTVTATDINNHAGSLVSALWQDLEAVRRFKRWLDDSTHNDSYLTALGISGGDITTLRTSFSDLGSNTNGLYAVAHGVFTPAAVNDFFFTAKNLTGIYYSG